jgi:hypothetical protein
MIDPKLLKCYHQFLTTAQQVNIQRNEVFHTMSITLGALAFLISIALLYRLRKRPSVSLAYYLVGNGALFSLACFCSGVLCLVQDRSDPIHYQVYVRTEFAFIYLIIVGIATNDTLISFTYFNATLRMVRAPTMVQKWQMVQGCVYIVFLAYSAWFVHAVVSFAVEIGFNTSLYIERYLKTGVWIIPSEIRAALAIFITYICLSYCLIFYSMGMSIWRLNKINLAGNPQAKLNLKIIAIHLIALLLTVSSLMFYLGFASSYVSPDGTCDRKLEMFEQMPRVLCVFEIMQFLSQMVIFSIVYMYTTATQELQSVVAKT